jgi:regulator of RNase E activity RraA
MNPPTLHWQDDDELFPILRHELFTAVVGDVMDKMGLQRQFLPPGIRPLHGDMVVAGRAMPVLEADVFGEAVPNTANPALQQPFGLMFRALDDLKRHEVYVCTGASPRYALWGELMSIRARTLGAAGAVLDGYSRDTRGILELGYPVFSYGSYAQDQAPRGKVIDFRLPIEIGGVVIRPGDILFGDMDGVLVVPQTAEKEVLQAAYAKVHGENTVRAALLAGETAEAVFRRLGIM